MRVFITGAAGFIGMALTRDLIAAGHQVLGMTRSEAGAEALGAAGAEPYHATLEDLDAVKRGAAQADAVAHLAFNHDFSTYMQNCADDRRVIEALASVLQSSDRPMLVTSGTLMGSGQPGQPSTEEDPPASSATVPRAASEEAATAAVEAGANVGVVRLPQVHDEARQGLITYAVQAAIEKGVSGYLGDGANRWAACHVSDAARVYRLALERAKPGARYNAVGEEGVAMRDIAEVLGKRLGLPVRSIPPEQAGTSASWPCSPTVTPRRPAP